MVRSSQVECFFFSIFLSIPLSVLRILWFIFFVHCVSGGDEEGRGGGRGWGRDRGLGSTVRLTQRQSLASGFRHGEYPAAHRFRNRCLACVRSLVRPFVYRACVTSETPGTQLQRHKKNDVYLSPSLSLYLYVIKVHGAIAASAAFSGNDLCLSLVGQLLLPPFVPIYRIIIIIIQK